MSQSTASALGANLADVPGPVRDRVMVFRLLIILGGQLRALMDRRLESSGITTQQAALLAIAGAADAPLTQGELASSLGVSHQNVRQLADALERKRLLEVRVDPDDRRSRQMLPTKAVQRLFARRNPGDFEAVAGWLSALDDREVETLVALLRRLGKSIAEERSRATATPRRRSVK